MESKSNGYFETEVKTLKFDFTVKLFVFHILL